MRLVQLMLFLLATNIGWGQITLEDLFEKNTFAPKGIKQMRSIGNGLYTTADAKEGILINSYADRNYRKVLLDSLVYNGTRIYYSNYTLNENKDKLLLTANAEPIYRHSFKADYFVVDIANKSVTKLTKKGKVQQATFSPDGQMVAYVKDNDLYAFHIDSKEEKRLTTDGKFTQIINGLPDWVYEEEFSFSRAFEWSPNSKQIAYMKFDESKVKTYTLFTFDNDSNYPTPYTYKYPKAGETNATVGVFVYDLDSNKNTELTVGKENDQYIPRIRWTKNTNELMILRLNRHQNKLDYLLAETKSGQVNTVYTEKNKYFIDAGNFDAIHFLDHTTFAFLSEQNGYNSLYTYNYTTKKTTPWVVEEWDITQFYGIDALGNAYFQSAMETPKNREILMANKRGKTTVLSDKKGYNTASFDKDFQYYTLIHTTTTQPYTYTVKSLFSTDSYILQDNKELKDKYIKANLPKKEFIELPSAEKGTMLSAWRMLPNDFNAEKKYPVLITQYNGPNSQQVRNTFSVSWYEYLAQEGYIVYCVDTRGTAGRGENFRKATYLNLGKLETEDMIAVGKYLTNLPYIDSKNLTIWGWSYGGFMSSLVLMQSEGIYQTAIAVAPVTHWKFYDTIYTERYMRTPQENPEGYNKNSPLENIDKLQKGLNLLLVHGTADDNVHVQNTYTLSSKLVAKDIPFDTYIYADKNHGIYGGKTRLHLYKVFMRFLEQTQK